MCLSAFGPEAGLDPKAGLDGLAAGGGSVLTLLSVGRDGPLFGWGLLFVGCG